MSGNKRKKSGEPRVICSYCKKILRGAELWEANADVCLAENSGDASHGICPDCLLRNFPAEYLAIQEERKVRIRNVFKKGFTEFYGHLVK